METTIINTDANLEINAASIRNWPSKVDAMKKTIVTPTHMSFGDTFIQTFYYFVSAFLIWVVLSVVLFIFYIFFGASMVALFHFVK